MRGFKGKQWVSEAYSKLKNAFGKIQLNNRIKKTIETVSIQPAIQWIKQHKYRVISAFGAIGLTVAISIAGNHYVNSNTYEVYHVYIGAKEAGTVSDPAIVEKHVQEKYEQLKDQYPDVHLVMNDDEIMFEPERAFKAKSDDVEAISTLDGLLTYEALGVEVRVEGELIGIVKDQQTADQIFAQIKEQYTPAASNRVVALGAQADSEESSQGKTKEEVESIEFIEDVSTKQITTTRPEDIVSPDDVLNRLQESQVEGITYVVEAGDCVSCIAQKLGISSEYIYEKHPELKDELLQIGQELNLTELIPKVSVEAVLIREEVHDVHYETEYQNDDTMKKGQTAVIREGKEGKKNVTFRITQVNGKDREMEIIDEEIIVQPISAIVKRGTKVIRGEGSGTFAWPVVGARITSGYGKRWGSMHKGIDLVSKNRNILAADNGKVTFAGKKSGYGNAIIIDHNNGFQTLYAHLSQISVKSGTTVEKGEKIGVMGSTGNSTGVHLHFEIQKNGSAQNPMTYLSR